MGWGNRILILFIAFAAGMSYLVYRSMHVDFQLVEKDYYKSELQYQDVIDGTNRVNRLSSAVKIEQTKSGIELQLPAEMKNETVTGEVWFYCAYDKDKDKKVNLNSTGNIYLINASEIQPARYTVKINWTCKGKNYFSEKQLTVL
jgi:hypothetical protein